MNAADSIFVFNIAKLAVRSILSAASLHPKPGLTTPLDNDALDGTDFQRLLDGAMGLLPCFVNCASLGHETESMKPEEVMSLLRSVGQRGEHDALQATHGGLAMRGRIFLLGLLCASAARLSAQKRNLTPMALALTASSFVRGIAERDLWNIEENTEDGARTDGEQAYILYGMEGCRGEAEHGFQLTLSAAVQLLNLAGTHGHLPMRERAIHVLLSVIAENTDTSIARRGGIDSLFQVQEAAKNAISAGGMLTPRGREALSAMDIDFRRRGVSPRGSCAILSAAMFVISLGELRMTRSEPEE